MPITIPWHSVQQSVHHNHTSCSTGKGIDHENRRGGTGGKRLCDQCKQLIQQGK